VIQVTVYVIGDTSSDAEIDSTSFKVYPNPPLEIENVLIDPRPLIAYENPDPEPYGGVKVKTASPDKDGRLFITTAVLEEIEDTTVFAAKTPVPEVLVTTDPICIFAVDGTAIVYCCVIGVENVNVADPDVDGFEERVIVVPLTFITVVFPLSNPTDP
jgi:hypothetical protein